MNPERITSIQLRILFAFNSLKKRNKPLLRLDSLRPRGLKGKAALAKALDQAAMPEERLAGKVLSML